MSTPDPTTHVEELLPAYAVGATDERETALVADHVATCETCREMLEEYEESVALLTAAAPSVAPPERLRRALMAQVTGGPAFVEPAPAAPAVTGRRLPAWVAAGAGIAAGLVIGVGLGGGFAYVQLRGDVDRIEEIVGDGRVVSYLAATPQTVVMVLEAQPEAGPMAERAYAMLMAPPSGRLGVLVAGGMEALPSGQAYQLWIVAEGKRMDGGMFTVDERGWGQVEFTPPEPMAHIQQVGITIEPASGSSVPTGPPLLAWAES